MPPPKISVMPGLRMSTRAGNKDKHPGIVDLPSPRRDRDVLEEERQHVAAKKQLEALQELARLEDAQLLEAEDREQKRRTGKSNGTSSGSSSRTSIEQTQTTQPKNKCSNDKENTLTIPSIPAKKPEKREAAKKVKGKMSAIEIESDDSGDASFEENSKGEGSNDSEDSDEDVATDSGIEESSSKKRKSRKKDKKNKKNKKKAKPTPREIVGTMRQTQPASGAETVKKRKALADASLNGDAKKAKVHGIDPEWEKALKKHEGRTAAKAAQSSEPAKEDDDSMVQPGGLAAEDESDVEAKALIANPSHLVLGLKKPVKKLYANVKIEANTAQSSKSTLKSLCTGTGSLTGIALTGAG